MKIIFNKACEEFDITEDVLKSILSQLKLDFEDIRDVIFIDIGMRACNAIIKMFNDSEFFLKINCGNKLFSFEKKYNKYNNIRLKQIVKFLNKFRTYLTVNTIGLLVPKIYKHITFNSYIYRKHKLYGVNVFLMEKLKAKHFKTKKKNLTIINKHRIEFYSKNNINKLIGSVANFHLYNENYNNVQIYPFFKLNIFNTEQFKFFYKKLFFVVKNNCYLERSIKCVIKEYLTIINSVLKIKIKIYDNFNFKQLNDLKNTIINIAWTYYSVKLDYNKLDEDIYIYRNLFDIKFLTISKYFFILSSMFNVLNNKFKVIYIFGRLKEINIERISKLPEIICHNDIHFLNVMEDKDLLYLIDFDKTGLNKRIYDLGLIFVKNTPTKNNIEYVIDSYIKAGGTITYDEAELVYDLFSLISITNFLKEYNDLFGILCNSYLDIKAKYKVKRILNIDKYYNELIKLQQLSDTNIPLKVLTNLRKKTN